MTIQSKLDKLLSRDGIRHWRINGATYVWQKKDWTDSALLDVDEQVLAYITQLPACP